MNTLNIESKPNRIVRRVANLVLATALLSAFSAQAQHYPASLDAPTKRDLDNIDQLLAIAQANGNVRVDVKFKLPASVNSINTPTELNARRQAILAYIDAAGTGFRARYDGHIIETPGNLFVHAEVSPMLQVTLTETGATQLMSDTSVVWVSNQANVTAFLKEINSSLAVSNSDPAIPTLPPMLASNKVLAIIDSGVRLDHVDFGGSCFVGNQCFSTSVGTFASSSTALPSLCPTTLGSPCDSTDSRLQGVINTCGHGTHVAGIALANTNAFSSGGMAPAAKIMSLQTKSARATGQGNAPYKDQQNPIDVVRALDYVYSFNVNNSVNKVVAVNMSFGISIFDTFDPLNTCLESHQPWSDAIARLHNGGVAVVAAAGNVINSAGLAFPACLPTVVSVAASDKAFQPVSYSHYASIPIGGAIQKLATVVAPGGDLFGATDLTPDPCALDASNTGPVCATTKNNTQNREQRSGTSMSSPIMAGLITRLAHRFPNRSAVQIAELLVNTGAPFAYNVGAPNIPRVRPLEAFKVASVPLALSASTATCGQINLTWTAPSIMQATGYKVRSANSVAGLATATITSTTNGATSFTISNVNQPQFAQVLAVDAQGDGAWSDSVSATPTPCAPAAISSIQIVGPPTQCTDTTFLGCRTVQWSATANATQYELEHSFSTSFTGTATRTITTTSDSVRYGFAKIRACNTTCGPWSGTLAVDAGQNE